MNLDLKMKFSQNELGYYFKDSEILVFFGNATATAEKIESLYSQYKFFRLKQTHSDILVTASDNVAEGDAHWTDKKNYALRISTADCIPLMVFCKQTKRIMGAHAGWKGVVNQIALKSLAQLINTGSTERDFNFFIGPHIVKNSFEVSEDTFIQLEKSHYGLTRKDYVTEVTPKYFVDLKEIVTSQIDYITGRKNQIYSLDIDTKTNSDFFSYRRGKLTNERNLSFIVRL